MKRFIVPCAVLLSLFLGTGECRSSVAVEEEEVIFRIAGAPGERIHLVGDFNGWNPTIDLMVEAEDGFEIRLFLLPGAYRYRFIVDGVSKPDKDNPCLDASGNSCFVLAERNGVLEVFLAESIETRDRSVRTALAPAARIAAVQCGGSGSLYSSWLIAASIDERIEADLAVGLTGDWPEGRSASAEAFLLRGLAAYRFERGVLRVFTRPSTAIDLGDPAGLIGTVGPYRYPASLFFRGVELDGTLPLNIEGRILFANRLRGYRTGLEGRADSSDLFSRRDFEGSDVYGFKVGTKIRNAAVHYLFRENRVLKDGFWRSPSSAGDFMAGYERNEFQGVSVSIPAGGVTLDGELLFGERFLSATRRFVDNANGYDYIEDIALESTWERGRRIIAGLRRLGERSRAELLFTRTTLEGERAARGGRPDGSRSSLEGIFDFSDAGLSIGVSGRVEQFSPLNTGSVFWLGRTNFWLDGDELTYDRIPFLFSTHLCEVKLSCGVNREPRGDYPWGTGLGIEVTERWDGRNAGPRFGEIRLVNGMEVHDRAAILLDMRGVSYEYGGAGRDYVDAFLSLRGSVRKGLWCAVGTGVSPYAFDRWLYSFSDHGREEYLAERGLFRALDAGGGAIPMDALLLAEESLAEDWIVTIEAGCAF